jgi:rRNA maturation protein Rpf1
LATTEITDPSEDCSNKAVIVTNRFRVEASKAALFEEQGGAADIEIIGECRVRVSRLAYLLIDTRHDVEVAFSVISVIGKGEFIDRGPPTSVGTWDIAIGVVHRPSSTDQINIAHY